MHFVMIIVKPIDVADFCINYKMIHMINGCFVS